MRGNPPAGWALKRLLLRLELDSHVEVPADEHDPGAGLQHRGLGMPEIIGCVDDEGEAFGRFDAPARPARSPHGVAPIRHRRIEKISGMSRGDLSPAPVITAGR